jgi:hypothetical protein
VIEHLAKIEGPFAGVDPLLVFVGVALLAAVLGATAVVARQVAQLTPKPGAAAKARSAEAAKAGAELEAWTEKPAAARDYETEYYSMYGSAPSRQADFVSPNAPAAPAAPATGGRDVVATIGGPAPPTPWGPAPEARPPPRAHAPFAPPQEPAGPTDEVVVPTHARGVRAADPWKDLATARPADPSFDRSSTRAGAPPAAPPVPRVERGQPAPRAAPPAQRAPPVPQGPRPGSARSTFRTPPGGQAVVGAADLGAKEGADLAAERKAIRCPKCSTVFPGPATRPATVKCPACGTTGLMK